MFPAEVYIKKLFFNAVGLIALWLPLLSSAVSAEKATVSIRNDVVPQLLVITSIKPLALIAQAALGHSINVEFLQSANQSAHDLTLTASALDKIHRASLIVLVGDQFEPHVAKVVQDIPGKALLQVLDLFTFDGEVDVYQQRVDPHVWLNPYSANVIGHAIQVALGVPQRDIISDSEIEVLKKTLEPVGTLGYISHHAVLGHFADAFNVSAGMPIRDSNGGHKGARSQFLLRKAAYDGGAQCVFVEPQYADKDALVIAGELNLPLRTIDPQGIDAPLTENGYVQFVQSLVVQFQACFG